MNKLEELENNLIFLIFFEQDFDPIYQVSNPNPILKPDVTLVTSFFDIGMFQKGTDQTYTADKYVGWMSTFRFIDNPLYMYVDKDKYADIFRRVRQNGLRNRTKIIILDRRKMWSFNLKSNISRIFSNPSYPKFYPNTVNPEYSCAMHAKYEVIKRSAKENFFNTKYFAWIDVGFFREMANMSETNHDSFTIHTPSKFNDTKVAYNEVFSPWRLSLRQIMRGNKVWVGGGFFLGDVDVIQTWAEDYMYYTERFIEQRLMNTDQQVVYAMAQPSIHKKLGKRRVAIQPYKGDNSSDWFYLGYLCRKNS